MFKHLSSAVRKCDGPHQYRVTSVLGAGLLAGRIFDYRDPSLGIIAEPRLSGRRGDPDDATRGIVFLNTLLPERVGHLHATAICAPLGGGHASARIDAAHPVYGIAILVPLLAPIGPSAARDPSLRIVCKLDHTSSRVTDLGQQTAVAVCVANRGAAIDLDSGQMIFLIGVPGGCTR